MKINEYHFSLDLRIMKIIWFAVFRINALSSVQFIEWSTDFIKTHYRVRTKWHLCEVFLCIQKISIKYNLRSTNRLQSHICVISFLIKTLRFIEKRLTATDSSGKAVKNNDNKVCAKIWFHQQQKKISY